MGKLATKPYLAASLNILEQTCYINPFHQPRFPSNWGFLNLSAANCTLPA
jgi:hypothetical protein